MVIKSIEKLQCLSREDNQDLQRFSQNWDGEQSTNGLIEISLTNKVKILKKTLKTRRQGGLIKF